MSEAAEMEMPRYVSHKKVWALEIATINRMVPGKVTLSFVDKGYAPLTFDEDDPMLVRYSPIQRDFYVVYKDGYRSLSPRKAFIEGYTRDEPDALELGAAARGVK
ncbi:hypothetical protein [Bradyrhizobium sp. RT9a]|uniref:hypothetical protein n=1 Tax=Bradyrhizobium sp. RT9a TaxID=3156384 RepID=UPI003393140F